MQELALLIARRLAEWHNRHPLARRVTADDVHSLGLVALPFMRASVAPSVEPVLSTLDDVVSPEELAAAQQGAQGGASGEAPDEDPTLAVLTKKKAASPAPPPATPPAPAADAAPKTSSPGLTVHLRRLTALIPFAKRANGSPSMWPVFSKSLIPGISARQSARFALLYGYRQAPDDGTLPRRVLSIDERLAAKPRNKDGAWPTEIYLLSAAIDAGSARTRVLLAQGPGQTIHVTGPRCLAPLRLALATVVLLGLPALAAGLWWWHGEAPAPAAPPAPSAAASAASIATPAAPTAAPALAASAQGPAEAGPPTGAASAAAVPPAPSSPSPEEKPAESPAERPHEAAPSAPVAAPATAANGKTNSILSTSEQIMSGQTGDSRNQPDIRPHLMPTTPRLVQKTTINPGASGESAKVANPAAEHGKGSPTSPGKPSPQAEPAKDERTQYRNAKSGEGPAQASVENMKQVALVGPPLPSKDEAMAYLQRMQNMAAPLIGSKTMQSQVFQTPEGWRGAIWPFGSREEAQLINATLIARGLRTKAIDF